MRSSVPSQRFGTNDKGCVSSQGGPIRSQFCAPSPPGGAEIGNELWTRDNSAGVTHSRDSDRCNLTAKRTRWRGRGGATSWQRKERKSMTDHATIADRQQAARFEDLPKLIVRRQLNRSGNTLMAAIE